MFSELFFINLLVFRCCNLFKIYNCYENH
jgi:hypothetical protein